MEQFVGLDVSQEMTHLCVIGGDGKIVWQGVSVDTRSHRRDHSDRERLTLYASDWKAVLYRPGTGTP